MIQLLVKENVPLPGVQLSHTAEKDAKENLCIIMIDCWFVSKKPVQSNATGLQTSALQTIFSLGFRGDSFPNVWSTYRGTMRSFQVITRSPHSGPPQQVQFPLRSRLVVHLLYWTGAVVATVC